MGEWTALPEHGTYLPIADHALIGDGRASALVGLDGGIRWLCAPRFDSPPLLRGLLDQNAGGEFTISADDVREARQYYLDDSGIVVTELRTSGGDVIEITDLLTLRNGARLSDDARAARGQLLRRVRVRHGRVRLRVALRPYREVVVSQSGGGLDLWWEPNPDLGLHLLTSHPLRPTTVDAALDLPAGDQFWAALSWDGQGDRTRAVEPDRLIDDTLRAWQGWAAGIVYDGPQVALVRRSAITLKLLDHFENGAIVAAPTSSLPEAVGGVRNWDYRYTWIRDAAFSVFALRRIGLGVEADGFLNWVLNAVESDGRPRVLYDLDGRVPPSEWQDPDLSGYRGSAPVRWGNAAASQTQHDAYGEILDCAFQWAAGGGKIDPNLWRIMAGLADAAATVWREPDHGIWEVRAPTRPFTYSVAMCHVALDRAARLSQRLGLPGDADRWAAESQHIRDRLLADAWDPGQNALTEHLGPDGGLDASLLALPLRRVLAADDPRMIATCRAVCQRLYAGDGLLYRYLPEESPDGLPGGEGAFVLCSFWLADNLLGQGELEQAMAQFERMCARTNHVGLLAEQIDPGSGAFLGNFPQAFSHVGLISSAVALNRALKGSPPELSTHSWFSS